jgi:ParB-like chromosome segregation protein Spo0J
MSRPHVTAKGSRPANATRPAAREKLAVESWPTSRPIPYARNARLCPQSAIEKVASSIREFGFQQAIVVDAGGVVIAGHTRLLAAKQLGLPTQYPCTWRPTSPPRR